MLDKQRDMGANHSAHSHWGVPAEDCPSKKPGTKRPLPELDVRFSDGGRRSLRSQFPLMPREGLGWNRGQPVMRGL